MLFSTLLTSIALATGAQAICAQFFMRLEMNVVHTGELHQDGQKICDFQGWNWHHEDPPASRQLSCIEHYAANALILGQAELKIYWSYPRHN